MFFTKDGPKIKDGQETDGIVSSSPSDIYKPPPWFFAIVQQKLTLENHMKTFRSLKFEFHLQIVAHQYY